jgi:hypothetical protein
VTTWLLKENDIFISVDSFFDQTASQENIEALEECEIEGITYTELEDTIKLFPEFAHHRDIIKTDYYKRSHTLATIKGLSHLERYEWLLKTDIELTTRVPAEYLASYLGMSKDNLFRARQIVARKKRK